MFFFVIPGQVFGLGNTTYEHYNAVAKLTDSCLEKLGGKRVYELGLGDDDGKCVWAAAGSHPPLLPHSPPPPSSSLALRRTL